MNEEQRKGEVARSLRIGSATHTINSVDKVPSSPHFAVLVNDTYHTHDGYSEREGGGYHAVNCVHYIVFDNQEALEDWILKNHTSKTYIVLHAKPVQVQLKTVINLGEE